MPFPCTVLLLCIRQLFDPGYAELPDQVAELSFDLCRRSPKAAIRIGTQIFFPPMTITKYGGIIFRSAVPI
ncbi:hypothetical protein [Methanoregula sp.]|uniref:hypothetical protein n=1 Tax=Methanoregula sp. TaxID=2052170 RepID=UPI003C71B9DB